MYDVMQGDCKFFKNQYQNYFLSNSKDLPILLCLRSLSRDTSRMAVQGAPSSCSNRISLRATKLSVNLDLPLKTVAYVPCKKYQRVRKVGLASHPDQQKVSKAEAASHRLNLAPHLHKRRRQSMTRLQKRGKISEHRNFPMQRTAVQAETKI